MSAHDAAPPARATVHGQRHRDAALPIMVLALVAVFYASLVYLTFRESDPSGELAHGEVHVLPPAGRRGPRAAGASPGYPTRADLMFDHSRVAPVGVGPGKSWHYPEP